MADVEACRSPSDDPSSGSGAVLVTILHGLMVTILFSGSLFVYLHSRDYVASLVVELVAYAAVSCLYIYNSSRRQEKFIFAGYLVLVLSVFILYSNRIIPNAYYGDLVPAIGEIVFGANMVAITSYCVWHLSFILPTKLTNSIMATILHAAIVAILFALIIIGRYKLDTKDYYSERDTPCLVQLVAYNAVCCLYMCNCSRQEKAKSVGFLVLLLLSSLVSSFAHRDLRTIFIFTANIVAMSSYCIWKLYTLLRRWFHALDGDVVPVPREPARQLEAAVPQLQLNLVPREPAQQEEAVPQHQLNPFHIQKVLHEFSSDEIQSMTQDFGSIIGRGGSAQVFRGNLDDSTSVAAKRINIHGGRTVAGEEDFRRELSIVANAHHRSLVRLLGYCLQRGAGLYLVYPFFENGSLDRWIFHGSEEQRRQLTWPKRLGIAIDVARALAYLHNECHWRILHLDVKPGNILLDSDLRAHVSDFGISLSITRGLNSVVDTEHLKGTFGYMAPEMLYNAVSDKSDVFSYGMTLLELVGGRRNMYPSSSETTTDLTRDYFPYIVREKVARGEVFGAVDVAMTPVDDEEAVMTVLKVALCCIQNQREMRPTMQTVVDMLEGRAAVELPPENRHHLL